MARGDSLKLKPDRLAQPLHPFVDSFSQRGRGLHRSGAPGVRVGYAVPAIRLSSYSYVAMILVQ